MNETITKRNPLPVGLFGAISDLALIRLRVSGMTIPKTLTTGLPTHLFYDIVYEPMTGMYLREVPRQSSQGK